MVSLDNEFFDSLATTNPIKGVILIDAAGLDMYSYLNHEGFEEGDTYLKTFTAEPSVWKKASPVYYLKNKMPPFLVFQGSRTYPSVRESNELFMRKLLPLAPATKYEIIKGKKHVAMITQFFNTRDPRYKEIINFMDSAGNPAR